MKTIKKYLNRKAGFIRFKRIEINWSIYLWALPLMIEFTEYLLFIRFFCISIIIFKNKKS